MLTARFELALSRPSTWCLCLIGLRERDRHVSPGVYCARFRPGGGRGPHRWFPYSIGILPCLLEPPYGLEPYPAPYERAVLPHVTTEAWSDTAAPPLVVLPRIARATVRVPDLGFEPRPVTGLSRVPLPVGVVRLGGDDEIRTRSRLLAREVLAIQLHPRVNVRWRWQLAHTNSHLAISALSLSTEAAALTMLAMARSFEVPTWSKSMTYDG